MGAATSSVTRQVVAERLEAPTDLAVSTSGLVLVTERRRGLLLIEAGRAARVVFAPADLDVSNGGGMLSVALDPDFETTRCVYVFMRSSRDGQPASRVVRLAFDEDLARVLERRDIVVAQDSVKASDRAPEANFGGALRFGPDGYLYVGVGDGRSATAPQSLGALDGKILRVDRNGLAAIKTAPQQASGDPRIFAYGLRDPVALAFSAEGRSILVVERRTDGRDTVLQLEQGENAGWDPRCKQQPTAYCAGSDEQMSAIGYLARSPAWRSTKAGEGLSGLLQFNGIDWPGWRRPTVVGYERASRLDLVQFASQGGSARVTSALEGIGTGTKALAQSRRDVYVLTSGKPGGQEVWRLMLR
jgi:aldose sugar dehydrogenase